MAPDISSPPAELTPQEVVLRFLESTGRPSEARLYLGLFRARPAEQFAAISIDANVMADAADAVVQDLRFLAALGLFPTVALGVFRNAGAAAHARELRSYLEDEGVRVQVLDATASDLAARVTSCARGGEVPIVVFEPPRNGDAESPSRPGDDRPAERLERLGDLLEEVQSRKLIFLHRPGGLRQGGVLVPIVNLMTDVPALLASPEISRKEALILKEARRLCEKTAPLPFTVAVTSPLSLLRELFTVQGAGTLLRRGARIARHEGWEGVDVSRLRELLTSSFGRAPTEEFFARTPSRVYVEEGYRGCIVLSESPHGAYLTKFAVAAEAQGEGLARDLWDALVPETPVVFWRARRTNPISEWYARLCDGFVRVPDWTVYWKGLAHDAIPAAIGWAVAQPVDIPQDAS